MIEQQPKNAETLVIMQKHPLSLKIQISQFLIMEFLQHFNNKAYVAFSGGKDSTVLLDLVRRVNPNILAVFNDTGLEYPEIREFVKTKDNVHFLKPKKSFLQVIQEYGYPVISKEVSETVYYARKGNAKALAKLQGNRTDKRGDVSRYNKQKYEYLLDADFPIGSQCCYHLKKGPAKSFERASGLRPITGMMAEESLMRKNSWLKHGCNSFNAKEPKSAPKFLDRARCA